MAKRGRNKDLAEKQDHEFDTEQELKYQFTKYPDEYAVGDILFIDSDNQEGSKKYEVIQKDGKKILEELESHSMDDARELDLEDKPKKVWRLKYPKTAEDALIENDEIRVGDIINVPPDEHSQQGHERYNVVEGENGEKTLEYFQPDDGEFYDGGKTKKSKKSRKSKKNKKSRKTKKANKKSRKTKKSNKK